MWAQLNIYSTRDDACEFLGLSILELFETSLNPSSCLTALPSNTKFMNIACMLAHDKGVILSLGLHLQSGTRPSGYKH